MLASQSSSRTPISAERPAEVSFSQVLLFREPESCRALAALTWAAFKEVAAFYQLSHLQPRFVRFYAGATVPAFVKRELPTERTFSGGALGRLPWDGFESRSGGTYDARLIGDLVRKLTGAKDHLLVITDAELTPPDDWRYVIWDDCGRGTAISVVPIDPQHWGIRAPSRFATIKHRVRTACLSAAGTAIGLEECHFPDCFLNGGVDSADALDAMVVLGKEHQIPERTGRGFNPTPRDPNKVQRLVSPGTSDATLVLAR